MTIIDAQVHVWKADTPERRHVKEDASKPHRATPLTYESLLEEMKTAGVDRVILVPPSWDGYRNDYALEAAQKYPDHFAVMGKVPLNDPASKEKLATWLQQPGMLGFRISFRHSNTYSWLDDGTAHWFWAGCERHDIPLMIFAPFAVAKIGEIADRHPGLRVIVDHMGLNVRWKGKDLAPGVDQLLEFARLRMSASKSPAYPATSTNPIPIRHFIRKFAASSTPSARKEFSGAPIYRSRPAPIAKTSPVHRSAGFPFRQRQRMDHGQSTGAVAALADG